MGVIFGVTIAKVIIKSFVIWEFETEEICQPNSHGRSQDIIIAIVILRIPIVIKFLDERGAL